MTLRIHLIGAGRMGKVFVNALASTMWEVDLVTVAEPKVDILEEVQNRL